jgi:outer membrane receptor protein involved in Fe transport
MRELVDSVTTPVDKLSETATRISSDADRVPASVITLTRAQMRNYGIDSLGDLLSVVPGYEVLDANWGERVLHHGLPETILFVLDGVPVSTAMHPMRILSRDFQVGLRPFERVEFVHGPGSVLWGGNALLGVVNFITPAPNAERPEAITIAEMGSRGTVDAHASVRQRRGRFGIGLSGTFRREAGPETIVDNSLYAMLLSPMPVWGNAGTATPVTDQYFDLFADFTVGDSLRLAFKEIDFDNHFEISPMGSLLSESSAGVWRRRHRIYSATWGERLYDGFAVRVNASRYELMSRESFVIHPATTVEGAFVDGLRSLQGNPEHPHLSHLVEVQLQHAGRIGWLESASLAGIGYQHQSVPDSIATMVGVEEEPLEPTISFTGKAFQTLAAFGHQTFTLGDRVAISGGARHELRDALPSGMLLQSGVVGLLGPVTAKVAYAEGFRPPPAVFLYSTVGTQGNPELEPETSRSLTAETTVRPIDPLAIRAGASATELSNLIVFDRDAVDEGFAYLPVNRGRIRLYSGFGEVRGRFAPWIEGFANSAVKHLDQDESGGLPIPVARYTLAGGVSVWQVRDVRLFGRAALISPRAVDYLVPTPTPNERIVDDQQLPVALRYAIGFSLTNVWNGFDVDVMLSNPLRYTHYTPYNLDGSPSPLLEPRVDSELYATVKWSL